MCFTRVLLVCEALSEWSDCWVYTPAAVFSNFCVLQMEVTALNLRTVLLLTILTVSVDIDVLRVFIFFYCKCCLFAIMQFFCTIFPNKWINKPMTIRQEAVFIVPSTSRGIFPQSQWSKHAPSPPLRLPSLPPSLSLTHPPSLPFLPLYSPPLPSLLFPSPPFFLLELG